MIASFRPLCLVMMCLLVLAAAAPAAALEKPGKDLPAVNLPDAEGVRHDLVGLTRDKVALLVYWSVSCPHCRREVPHILELARPFEGNPFVLLFINADPPAMAPAARAYAADNGMPGPLLMDLGPGDTAPYAEALDIIGTPAVAVVDARGRITLLQELKVDLDQVKKAIEAGF